MLVVLTFDKPPFVNGKSNHNFKVAFPDELLRCCTSHAVLPAKVQHRFHAAQRKSEPEGNGIFIQILPVEVQVGFAIGKAQPVMDPGEVVVVVVDVRSNLPADIQLPAVYE